MNTSFTTLVDGLKLMEEYENLINAHFGGLHDLSPYQHMNKYQRGKVKIPVDVPQGVVTRVERIIEQYETALSFGRAA